MKKIALGFAGLLGTQAFAQFSPSIGDLNTIFDPPANIQNTICSAYQTDIQKSICKDGVASARWMAEKYAKKAGAYLGCVDGLSQGLSRGFQMGRNPTPDMVRESKAYVENAKFESAILRAEAEATATGQTVSADQIISRYRAVIGKRDARGNPVLPNKEMSLPNITFQGYTDGYYFDVLRNDPTLANVQQSGWVTRESPWFDQVSASQIYRMQGQYNAQLCNMDGTVFGRRSMPALTLWDIFRTNGKFNFENYGWNNAAWAWEVLIEYEKTLDQYQTYVEINNRTKTITETIPIKTTRNKLDANGKVIAKKDATGNPVLNPDGSPVYETEEVITGYKNETRTVALSDSEKQALRDSYRNGFIESYQRYYARQYASQNYHSSALEKMSVGEIIGKGVGEKVAEHTARKNAYDEGYQRTAVGAYREKVHGNYRRSFKYLLSIFETNPVLELNSVQILGETEDAIFRANEKLFARFQGTNLGEVSRPSRFSVISGQGVTALNAFSFQIPALSPAEFISHPIAQISPNAMARTQIQMALGIQNPGDLKEVAQNLMVQKNEELQIRDLLEVDRAILSMDYLNGTLDAVVSLMNPASSNAAIVASTVRLNLGGLGQTSSEALSIPGGGKDQRRLRIQGVDPLFLIQSGSVSGSVSTQVGSRVVHEVSVTARTPVDLMTGTLAYFDALATQKTSNSGGKILSDRIAELITLLSNRTKDDVLKNVVWDKDKEVRETLIASVQRVYQESRAAGRMNAEAQAHYNALGQSFAQFRPLVKAGGGLRMNREGNRKDYINQIRKFAPGVR